MRLQTIHHLGAKNCVTGSCHLVQSRSINILVDCGTAYGHDPELPFDRFPVQPDKIDYLFLTHAHIDHIGRVPDLIDAGFKGEIICTHATKALLIPMLHDALSFSGRTDKDIHRLEAAIDDLSWGFELYETFSLKQGITFNLKNAGHILGSCFILFNFPGHNSDNFRVIFSGDLGCTDTPVLPDPDPPDCCDLLVMESTYGDRNHTSRRGRVEALEKLLHKALADKGIIYIPAFALGRTQKLLYELDRIKVKVPVFLDSPLGVEITKIYSDLEEFWDKEAKKLKASGDHPFDFKNLYAVEKYQDHKRLLNIKGPAIIIAGSGMCTGGRIVDLLKHGLDDPKNDIFFVGYQAKGTPGRQIIDREVHVKASIHRMTKKALITGITGQDGAYLAELLLEKGYEVHGIKRRASLFNTDRIDHLYQDPHEKNRHLVLHYGDLTDATNLIRILQQVQPDEVYNLAAQSHVQVSFESPEYTADTDGLSTMRLLEGIRLLGLEKKTRFYQASTSELYGMVQEPPQTAPPPSIPEAPMPAPSSMPTGSRSITGKPMAYMPAMASCSTMNLPYGVKPLSPERSPVPCVGSILACRSACILGT